MRRTLNNGGKLSLFAAVPIAEQRGNKYSAFEIAIADAETCSDRKLKSLLCCDGSIKNCARCESQCAYGREYIRRANK